MRPYLGPPWTDSCQIWCVRCFHHVLLKIWSWKCWNAKKKIWWCYTSVLYIVYIESRGLVCYSILKFWQCPVLHISCWYKYCQPHKPTSVSCLSSFLQLLCEPWFQFLWLRLICLYVIEPRNLKGGIQSHFDLHIMLWQQPPFWWSGMEGDLLYLRIIWCE